VIVDVHRLTCPSGGRDGPEGRDRPGGLYGSYGAERR